MVARIAVLKMEVNFAFSVCMNFHEEERFSKSEERQEQYRDESRIDSSLDVGVDLHATATCTSFSSFLLLLLICELEYNHLGSAEWHRHFVCHFMLLHGRKENGLAWTTRRLFYSTL